MRLAFSGLLSWLENHSTVITPSRFLASVGYRQFSQDRLARAQSSWQRPEIVSLGGWLTAEWQKARFAHSGVPALLSPAQEHVLWRRIIAEEQLALFDADSAASMASRANRLLAEWQISKQDDAWNDRGDAAQFQRWSHRLEQICRREGWIARSDLWTLLPKWQNPSAPGIFLLSEPPAPALKRILEAFRHTAYQNHDRQKAACPGTQFEDFEEELDFAARWARARFESHPSSSIAVFVPDLARNHQLVERTFRHIFYPASPRLLLGGVAAAHSAFSLHAPWPLASEPLIAAALLLLQVARPEIPMADATAILRCRWIKGYSNERNQRALADLDLRRRRDLDVALDDLESASARCPQFSGIWRSVRSRLAALQPLDNYAGWARFFADLLQAFGWPGDAELDTAETVLADAWLTTLSQLSSLSFVSGPVSIDTALADLRRLLETGHESQNLSSPVQILDAREASGLRFDVAIVTGLSEQTWPPLENRSPFIPFKLQRQRELPGSSPQLLRSRRAALTRSLFSVAPEIHATWSGRRAAVAGEFVSQNRESQPIWKGKSTWQAFKPAILEELDDSLAPPFVPSTTTRGGTGVIKAQSLCPFRAFAEYRLQSRSPEEGCLGLDSRERGGNLHQVLEFVWQKLRTRDRLASTDPRALEQLVEEAAAAVVRNQRASSFGKIVSAVEEQRL
ncbi:MAG TPA: hypothetical protein VHZ55_27310, partial [Bryobacteraceae bacterium]|nr:hypothetical protein [Bryobacteraceae bacterium]